MHLDKGKYVMLILFDLLIVHFLHSVYSDYFIYLKYENKFTFKIKD